MLTSLPVVTAQQKFLKNWFERAATPAAPAALAAASSADDTAATKTDAAPKPKQPKPLYRDIKTDARLSGAALSANQNIKAILDAYLKKRQQNNDQSQATASNQNTPAARDSRVNGKTDTVVGPRIPPEMQQKVPDFKHQDAWDLLMTVFAHNRIEVQYQDALPQPEQDTMCLLHDLSLITRSRSWAWHISDLSGNQLDLMLLPENPVKTDPNGAVLVYLKFTLQTTDTATPAPLICRFSTICPQPDEISFDQLLTELGDDADSILAEYNEHNLLPNKDNCLPSGVLAHHWHNEQEQECHIILQWEQLALHAATPERELRLPELFESTIKGLGMALIGTIKK